MNQKTYYFTLIYFNNKPLHVSSRRAVRHMGDQLCINSNWYSHALCWMVALYTELVLLMKSSTPVRKI